MNMNETLKAYLLPKQPDGPIFKAPIPEENEPAE